MDASTRDRILQLVAWLWVVVLAGVALSVSLLGFVAVVLGAGAAAAVVLVSQRGV